jgi:antitoxin (DNA-binding transcriptional repressor) of toxin-antitoxin stability system
VNYFLNNLSRKIVHLVINISGMKTLTVGEFKAQFSSVIEMIKAGEEVEVTFGKQKEVIGVFKPKEKKKARLRKFGTFNNTPGYYMAPDFNETTEEEFPINDEKW